MIRNRMPTVALTAFLGACLAATEGMTQEKKVDQKDLVGTWTLVSIYNRIPSGKIVRSFGAGDGIVVFDADGKFVQALARSDLPKFSSDTLNAGTADENRAVAQRSLTFFGTYKIEDDGTLVLHIDRSTFPNWNGTDQKRSITSLTGTELRWFVPLSRAGGTTVTVWKR